MSLLRCVRGRAGGLCTPTRLFSGPRRTPSRANTPDVSGLSVRRMICSFLPRCSPEGIGRYCRRPLCAGPNPGMRGSFQRCSRAPPATFRTGADISADGGGSETQRFVSLFGELNCRFPLLCSFHRLTSRLFLDFSFFFCLPRSWQRPRFAQYLTFNIHQTGIYAAIHS